LKEGKINYTDISSTDSNFSKFTSLGDYNSTMNFFIGTRANIDLNDNEYIRIRAYSYD
jgi:hypothetical protein